MRRRRTRVSLKKSDNNRWMVSYADFITLLFAFFVVLYAVSSVNVEKYRKIASTLEDVFSKPNKLSMASERENKLPSTKKKIASAQDTIFAKGNSELEKHNPFGSVKKKLQRLDPQFFKIKNNQDWVELEVKSRSLFSSGQAIPNDDALRQFEQLAQLLKSGKQPIAIEGYTDNKPIFTNKFPSNWELSAARAAAVARILVKLGISPSRVSAIGFGEQFPIADNQTNEGRQKNRRVVLIIAKNNAVQRLLNPILMEDVKKQAQKDKLRKTTIEVPVVREVVLPSGDIKFMRTTVRKARNTAKQKGE